MNKTIQYLNVEIESIKRIQTEGYLGMKVRNLINS